MPKARVSLLLWMASIALLAVNFCAAQPQVSPNPLSFPNLQPVGSPISGTLQVSIINPGTQALSISSATLTGDFAFGTSPPVQVLNNLPPIAGGASLNFVMLFNATASGLRTGTLTLVDNAAGSPHGFNVSGTGFVGAMIQPRGTELTLITDTLGTPATTVDQVVSVGNQAVTITSVAISGTGFAQTNDCGASMTQGQTCNITVSFNPPAAGPQTGTLTIANTGVTNPVTIPLTGDAADFSLAVDPAQTTATVTAGQTARYSFAVSSPDGLAGLGGMTFSCSGLPGASACMESFANETSTGFAAIMSITTTARSTARLRPSSPVWGWSLAGVVCLAFMCSRKRVYRAAALIVFLVAALSVSMISCGGGSTRQSFNSGTPAGTFTLAISATRMGLTRSFPVTLNVR